MLARIYILTLLILSLKFRSLLGLEDGNNNESEVEDRGKKMSKFPVSPNVHSRHFGAVNQPHTTEFKRQAAMGDKAVEKRKTEDASLVSQSVVAPKGSPTSFHQTLLKLPKEFEKLALGSVAIEETSRVKAPSTKNMHATLFLGQKIEMNTQDTLSKTMISDTTFGKTHCHPYPTCDIDGIYRTIDGSCNNRYDRLLGKSGTPVIRLIGAAYQDEFGLKDPRNMSITGDPLPCAREVSSKLAQSISKKDPKHTMMLMQWGQFVDHDLIFSPVAKLTSGYGSNSVQCCNARKQHSECFPICIPSSDPFYKKDCMEFVRTVGSPSIDCTLGPRQQMNALSHYLDGSNVYGSTDSQMKELRSFINGKMLVQPGDLLPPDPHAEECQSPGKCFKAGDGRVNEQPNLALTHTLWVREHNRIAEYISKTYPHCNDEEIFQKARRIVIAEIQHITYNEFLPIVLGSSYMNERDMLPQYAGHYYEGYSKSVDPSIANAFGAAAYRFGHSLLDDNVELHLEPPHTENVPVALSQLTFNMEHTHNPFMRMLFFYGLTKQSSQKVDMCFTKEVTEKLFEGNNGPGSGLDLVALNIQRGRDHGLPPYIFYRKFCHLPGVKSIDEMTWVPLSTRNILKDVYNNRVEDIDLFVGGLLEPAEEGSILGATFRCIIGDQFFRLKNGDRYFYENKGQPFPFKHYELKEIRKVTLARILCDNGKDITQIQKNVFLKYPPDPVSCSSIPSMDLSKFWLSCPKKPLSDAKDPRLDNLHILEQFLKKPVKGNHKS